MPLTLVIGGQYGGEGKGLITAHLAQKSDILIKIGGPNSAHSFGIDKKIFRVRMIPSGANLGPQSLVFPAGCLIHVDTLFDEIEQLQYKGNLFIDFNAGIIDNDIVKSQQDDSYYKNIGSTMTGTGHATSLRSLRRLKLAKDERRLKNYLCDTVKMIHRALVEKRHIVAEGAQAYGLSNYHGDYPYVSSRDTTAGSVLAQMGIGPKYVDDIILVIKCFPTRNMGGKGSMDNELTDDFIQKYKEHLLEIGGGTYGAEDRQRRVGLFDFDVVHRACIANTPTSIALTGIDRLNGLFGDEIVALHYGTPHEFITQIESRYQIPVSLFSQGPYLKDVVDRRNEVIKQN